MAKAKSGTAVDLKAEYDFTDPVNLLSEKRIKELMSMREQIRFLLWNRACVVDCTTPMRVGIYSAGKLWLSLNIVNLLLLIIYNEDDLWRILYSVQEKAERDKAGVKI